MNEIIKRMNEINARKAELRAMLEGTGEVDLDKVTTELRELDTEYKKLEQRKQTIEGINAGTIPATEIPNPVTARSAAKPKREKLRLCLTFLRQTTTAKRFTAKH